MASESSNAPTAFHRDRAGRILSMGKKSGEPAAAVGANAWTTYSVPSSRRVGGG